MDLGDEAMGKYFEKKRGYIWAILTILLFLFIFGGLEPFINNNLSSWNFTIVRLSLAFILVIVIGIIIWSIEILRKRVSSK